MKPPRYRVRKRNSVIFIKMQRICSVRSFLRRVKQVARRKNEKRERYFSKAFVAWIVFIFMGNADVLAASESNVLRAGAFSLSWSADLKYGSRRFAFDGERKFYFSEGDTINDKDKKGIGVFSLVLQNSELQDLKIVARTLCDKDIQSGGPETTDPGVTFSVVCTGEDGTAVHRSGSMRLIPERFNRAIFDLPYELAERAWTQGSRIIKLDFETLTVERKGNHRVVAVRFINSGERWIRFKTPDQWGGSTTAGLLGVSAANVFNKNGQKEKVDNSWAFALGGGKLINQNGFEDGWVLLNAGESKILKFEVNPSVEALRGGYEFTGAAFMRIEYEGDGWGLATNVDFRPIKSRVNIDHDYPSTPQEREEWEKTHREKISQRPVKPDATLTEDEL